MQNLDTAIWDQLGWAVLHSLWQSAAILVVVWALRAVATPKRPDLRFTISLSGLIATFAAFLATFFYLGLGQEGTGVIETSTLPSLSEGLTQSLRVIYPLTTGVEQIDISGFSAVALIPWLGLLWCAGFILLSVQASRAWMRTRKLATTGLSHPDQDWVNRFDGLLDLAGLKHIRLFVSDHIDSPLTLGALKPLVLVPAGFLAHLPPEQVEAVLLHELAHIRRNDFLIGLIQTAIKTALYFNPAVLVMSRLMDLDREEACDDFAVDRTGRPVDLVKGLAALRLGTAVPHLAMNAVGPGVSVGPAGGSGTTDGHSGPLLSRLERLMGRTPKRRTGRRKFDGLSAVAVSGLMIGAVAYASSGYAHPHQSEDKTEETYSFSETINEPASERIYTITPRQMRSVYVMPDTNTSMPPMPPMPAIPPIAPTPPFPNLLNLSETEAEAAMDAWDSQMEDWSETVEKSFEGEWGIDMEAWGKEVEAWGETFGKRVELRTEQMTVRSENRAERAKERAEHMAEIRSNQAKARADMARDREVRKMIAKRGESIAVYGPRHTGANGKAHRHTSESVSITQHNADHLNFNGQKIDIAALRTDLMSSLERDGLIDQVTQPLVLKVNCENLIVNQKPTTPEQLIKYKNFLINRGLIIDDTLTVKIKGRTVSFVMTGPDGNSIEMTVGSYTESRSK